ncbi:MAG: hypothetical protein D6681_06695 [Calditrichaeota bacterium]|nr:MAG: hypothetical protein D6681_06695 [Calditrichota bacterium]
MSCDFSKERLIAYICEDFSPEEKQAVEAHLAGCEDCRREVEALGKTVALLRQWPEESPGAQFLFLEPPPKQPPASGAGRLSEKSPVQRALRIMAAVAACLVIAVSVLTFDALYNKGKVAQVFGLTPETISPATDPGASSSAVLSREEFLRWEQTHRRWVQQLLVESELRQQKHLQATLGQFARELEMQRREDLQLIGQGLEALYRNHERRFQTTDQLLKEFIQTAAFSQPRPQQ